FRKSEPQRLADIRTEQRTQIEVERVITGDQRIPGVRLVQIQKHVRRRHRKRIRTGFQNVDTGLLIQNRSAEIQCCRCRKGVGAIADKQAEAQSSAGCRYDEVMIQNVTAGTESIGHCGESTSGGCGYAVEICGTHCSRLQEKVSFT